MMRRFYAAEIEFPGRLILDETQSRHIAGVLRYSVGEPLNLFDGKGSEFEAKVVSVGKNRVEVELTQRVTPRCPESNFHLILGVPMLKANKSDLIIHKAVELGVTELWPFHSLRAEVPLKKWRTERMYKIAVEAAKQCGRATIPGIEDPIEFPKLVEKADSRAILFYEEDSDPVSFEQPTDKLLIVTGPEGGWESSEVEFARRSGFEAVHFNGRILKAETAAIVATALAQHHYGDFN